MYAKHESKEKDKAESTDEEYFAILTMH